jgi:RNA polymerase sigma-70 factor (ECF subfamily)
LKEMLVDPASRPTTRGACGEPGAGGSGLEQVPEPFRTTLILRDIEGFVYEEVAEMQGVNLGTVKSRLVRGRAALKAILTGSAWRMRREGAKRECEHFEVPLGEEAR